MSFNEKIFGTGHSFERTIQPDGIELIRRWETFIPNWYPDGQRADGTTIYSCCYGHAEDGDNPPFKMTPGATFTHEMGMSILMSDIARKSHFIDTRVTSKLTTPMFGALTCLVFQYGNGRLENETPVLSLLNSEDYIDAADAILNLYKTKKNVPLKGLRLRRACEVAFYMTQIN